MAEPSRNEIVSFDEEPLILVDSDDNELGFLDKSACHDGDGLLHRAFSIFIFNRAGELLLQQRDPSKRLWGGYWSNSCCSHPRRGERIEEAVHRRLEQELGLTAELIFLFKFEYTAPFGTYGTEHELCSVYVGVTDDRPNVNYSEISDVRYMSAEDVDNALSRDPDTYTPWFKIEWDRLRTEYKEQIEDALNLR